MATLGGKPADWVKYVTNNPNSASIQYPIENNIKNEPVYKNTTLQEVVEYVNTGNFVNIISKQFTQISKSKYANVRLKNGKTGYIRITAIRKPTGKGGADAEQRTLDATINTIQTLEEVAGIGRGNRVGIDVLVPGIGMFIGITGIEKVSNRIHGREAKSDFVFKNSLGKGVLYISHKDGSGPSDFGQYGGVSTIAGNIQDAAKIYNNSEVQQYLTKLYRLYSDAIGGSPKIKNNPFSADGKLTKAVYSLIKDSSLVNMSVYGPDYGGSYGPDNVHMIGQGQFIFNPLVNEDGDVYFRLSFSGHQALNGQTREFLDDASGYRAALITTYRTGRPTQTPNGAVPETRTAIYPRRYRQSAIAIDSFS